MPVLIYFKYLVRLYFIDYHELKETLDDLESRIRSLEFPVNRFECGRCQYQKICDQKSAGMVYPRLEDPQINIFPVKERKKERTKQMHLRFYRQKKT